MIIVILAGGRGSRLWPLSQDAFPKQFLSFGEKHSLLQKTLLRFLKIVNAEKIFIVTSQEHLALVQRHAGEIDPYFMDQILVEPERKNTGPAIAFALRNLKEERDLPENEVVLIAPSDHYFSSEDSFLSLLHKAEKQAQNGNLIFFGVQPHKPETGYGYIKVRKGSPPYVVEAFVEKPDLQNARAYLMSGGYLWNTGIFLSQISTLLQEFALHAPELLSSDFRNLPSISIDHAIMEKTNKGLLIPLDCGWSDVGTWDNLYEALEKDENQNVKIGNIHDIETKNCLIIGGKKVISTIGLEDLVIVETDEALFLTKREKTTKRT